MEIIITAEDRERGRTRTLDEAVDALRHHYYQALVRDRTATIRISLSTDNGRSVVIDPA